MQRTLEPPPGLKNEAQLDLLRASLRAAGGTAPAAEEKQQDGVGSGRTSKSRRGGKKNGKKGAGGASDEKEEKGSSQQHSVHDGPQPKNGGRGNRGGKPKPSNPPAEKSKGNAGKSANESTLVAEHQGGEGAKQGKNSRGRKGGKGEAGGDGASTEHMGADGSSSNAHPTEGQQQRSQGRPKNSARRGDKGGKKPGTSGQVQRMNTDPSDAGEFRFNFQLKGSESGNGGDQGASQAKSRGGGSGGKAQSGPRVDVNEDSVSSQPTSEQKKKSRTKKGRFKEYWDQAELQKGMKTGTVFRALFRCNVSNRTEAYVGIDGLPMDVLIKGIADQNRAIVGDEVAVQVLPEEEWYEVQRGGEGGSAGLQAVEDGPTDSDKAARQWELPRNPEEAIANITQCLTANPNKRPRGRVVAILQKAARRERIIGSLMSEAKGLAALVPSDPRMPRMIVKMHTLPAHLKDELMYEWKNLMQYISGLSQEDCQKAAGTPHLLVSARLVAWDAHQVTPLAQVRESIGQAGEIETETAAILAAEGIEEADFSQDVIDCLPESPWEVDEEEIAKRRDFSGVWALALTRSVRVFTIDPLTARDLDDALSVQRLDNGLLRIGVHIADVTHFVKPNTALDDEAVSRSTSVYLVQRVIPMLPHLLCQELCSLNPGVDRLAFSAVWDMTAEGEIVSQWLGRTVIRSCVKLAYEHAQRIIDGSYTATEGEDPIPAPLQEPHTWKDVVEDVLCLAKVARNLRKDRFDSGALRLDNIKLGFTLDADGNPVGATPHVQREANQTIEEFMLLANRSVAKFISEVYPDRALLRRHCRPDQRQLDALQEATVKMGINLDISSSGALHNSLVQLREQMEPAVVDIITQQATKPMKLAEYFCTGPSKDSPEAWRHYALAMSHYTHFTSPIRRYPDVVVHRLLAAALDTQSGRSKEEAAAHFGLRDEERTSEVAKHANECKLSAKNAQDASLKIYLCVWLKAKPTILPGTLLPIGGNRFLAAYVAPLGVEVRVQVDEVHGCGDAFYNEAAGELTLQPKAGHTTVSTPSAPDGFVYGLPAVTNPQGLSPVQLPLVLRPLMSVPLVLTSSTSGSGRPSSLVAKLYVVA